MKVFVTRATGYIGGSVAIRLLKTGHHVMGLVRSEENAALTTLVPNLVGRRQARPCCTISSMAPTGNNILRDRAGTLTGILVAALAGAPTGCATHAADQAGIAPLQAYRQHTVELHVHDSLIKIVHAPRETPASEADLQLWVSTAAQAVQTYYGRFPVERVSVVVETIDGRGAQSGTTFGFGTPVIRMTVGRATVADDLPRDWMMTHEMVHLAFPRVLQEHHWIEEGLATYVEPIARAQAGQLPSERVWLDLIEGLPHGLPRAGDQGLDFTPTWGRTYWGGALYCLLADIQIRGRTDNQFGLQDALRGVLAAGATFKPSGPSSKPCKPATKPLAKRC